MCVGKTPERAGRSTPGTFPITIFAIAVGVLCGTLLLEGSVATGRLVGAASKSVTARTRWLNRILGRSDDQEEG